MLPHTPLHDVSLPQDPASSAADRMCEVGVFHMRQRLFPAEQPLVCVEVGSDRIPNEPVELYSILYECMQ